MTSEAVGKYRNFKGRNYSQRIFIFLIMATGSILLYTGVISPRNTWVTCDSFDLSLQHEYRPNTISATALLSVSLIGPFIQMIIIEWLNKSCRGQRHASFDKNILKKTYSYFLSLLFGCLVLIFIAELLKTGVSAPRPHFMNSCQPDLSSADCRNGWTHVTWANCSNPMNLSYIHLIDTMKSFPSSHAAIGVYSATFVTFYIGNYATKSWPSLLSMGILLLWWCWALICSFSRLWDFKHHLRDIVFGGIIGATVGTFTVKYLCRSFLNSSQNEFMTSHKDLRAEPCEKFQHFTSSQHFGERSMDIEHSLPDKL